MKDCLFCKIARREIPGQIVRDTPTLLAFRDIHPQAPTHVLVVPKEHVADVNALEPRHQAMIGELFLAAKEIAKAEGLEGYRLVVNTGASAGQSVFHIHLHLLGGRAFRWPPG